MTSLAQVAVDAVMKHPKSNIEMALEFVSKVCPRFTSQDNDRLVKVGRSLQNLVFLKDQIPFESSVKQLIEECDLLCSDIVKVPKIRFGKTELQMPILTLGCMRFQQEWGPRITNMNMVGSDCQDNLVRILHRAICDFGINHIETARGYGSSELQLGVALKQLFDSGVVKRQDIILQTKVGACSTAAEFRRTLETSFSLLQVDYVDLFSFHGLNLPHQYDWVFNNGLNGNCIDVVKEYVVAGKIRHVGFSSHAPEDLIRKLIETDAFSYVNLHYHYFGSYTTTGYGPSKGNLDNIRLLNEKDMGVFVISAYDKGGKLYQPSNKLRALTLPEMEPIAFGTAWLWTHDRHQGSVIHTTVCGAARPADLDQGAVSAYQFGKDPESYYSKVSSVLGRLEQAKVDALGQAWLDTCYDGILKSHESKFMVEHNQIIWCYNVIKAFGMYAFAKDRYWSLESNREKWDKTITTEAAIDKVGRIGWGYVPGLSLVPDEEDYTEDFTLVPDANKELVLQAESFVHKYLKKPSPGKKADEIELPIEWQDSYVMKPWTDFPDRPSRG